MIRTPLRPLARILRAREKGENPDEIEAENRAQRHAEIQEKARSSARSRLFFMAMGFMLAFGTVGTKMAVLASSQPSEPRAQTTGAQIISQR
nr:penicillin-binding protein 2 [Paracoccus sp. (in: a-proteobacteria)]